MATDAYIRHQENGTTAELDADHSGQKNYRTSQAVWLTVPVFSKCQAKLGVSAETVNASALFKKLANLAGIDVTMHDLNRAKSVLEAKPEPVAVAQAGKLNDLVTGLFHAGLAEPAIRQIMALSGCSQAEIDSQFKPVEAEPATMADKIAKFLASSGIKLK